MPNKETVTQSEPVLRKAKAGDEVNMATWLADLLQHVQATTHDPYLSTVVLSNTEEVCDLMRAWINAQDSIVYISSAGGVENGFIKAKLAKPFVAASPIKQIGLIEMLWIEPPYRRNGTASALVTAVEDWFTQQGIDYIDLHYMLGNQSAEDFWQQVGYSPYHVRCCKKL